MLQIPHKGGSHTQADLELSLEDELEGCVPLISPGNVKGSRHLGSERSTTPCINVIWCNASACSCNALVIWHPSFISKTSEDGTDHAKEGLGGLGITALHIDPGEGGNAS